MEASDSLTNKTILIVGATSLTGRRTALACARHGGRVIAVNRESGRLNDLLKELRAISSCPHAVEKFDIAESGKIHSFIDSLISFYGPVHGFVHSPGITSPCAFTEIRPELLERIFRINVISAFEFVRSLAVHPACPAKPVGIFCAPVSASDSPEGMTPHAFCRGAVIAGMRVISEELSTRDFRLNYLISDVLKRDGLSSFRLERAESCVDVMSLDAKAEKMAEDTVSLLSCKYDSISGELVMFGRERELEIMSLEAFPYNKILHGEKYYAG